MQIDLVNNVILAGAGRASNDKKALSSKKKGAAEIYHTTRSEYAEVIGKALVYSGLEEKTIEQIKNEVEQGNLDNKHTVRSAAKKIIETGI